MVQYLPENLLDSLDSLLDSLELLENSLSLPYSLLDLPKSSLNLLESSLDFPGEFPAEEFPEDSLGELPSLLPELPSSVLLSS